MSSITASHSVEGSNPAPGWLSFHNFLLALCVIVLTMRFYTVVLGGGWSDRAQFFGEGDIRPNLIDFIYNEVLVNYLILRVIAFRHSTLVYILILLSAFAYFSRLPLTLLFFAVIFSRCIKLRKKTFLAAIALLVSFFVLQLRFGGEAIYGENSSVFYFTYPLVGIGRLLGTSQEHGTTALQYLSLFLKPLDAILFVTDYVGQHGGELSTGRHVGLELTQFVYIQSLQGAYNAFGTILYPFILIAGWIVGPVLFAFLIVFQYLQYRFVTQDAELSRRYIYLLLTTGILFSWTSPFIWLVPFLFVKIKYRAHR